MKAYWKSEPLPPEVLVRWCMYKEDLRSGPRVMQNAMDRGMWRLAGGDYSVLRVSVNNLEQAQRLALAIEKLHGRIYDTTV